MYYSQNTLIYLDGSWIHPEKAGCDLYSQSLHYGHAVFEGIRAYQTRSGPRIYKGREHFERLKRSCELTHIPLSYTVGELLDVAYELLEKNGLKNAYLRPLVYTGADMSLRPSSESHLFMAAWEWGKYLGDNLLRVMISSYQRPNPKSTHIEAKTCGHYVNSMLAAREAKAMGYDEALLLDMNGHVAEGPGANFFFEKNGVLFTPPRGQILPGITRTAIINLACREGIEVREEFFRPQRVQMADSAFFTGTAAEVVGLKSLGDYVFPMKWEGSLGHRLSELYAEDVRRPREAAAA